MAERGGGGGGQNCGRKGGRRRREVHTNKTENNTPKPNCAGHQDVFQRTEIKNEFRITTDCVGLVVSLAFETTSS